jgi:predicted amidohydrolase YtcJ
MKKESIPLLRDHHNHLIIFALFYDCPNLTQIHSKSQAVKLIKDQDHHKVTVILGWNNSYYDFTREELENFPPVVIVNTSLHSFVMNPSAEKSLAGQYPKIVQNYKDSFWFECNLPSILIFLCNQIVPTLEKFERFFGYLEKQGIYYAEEMLMPNEECFNILKSSPFFHRTALWADYDTYINLDKNIQEDIRGIKIFTDGAIGTKTAALHVPYTDGTIGRPLYTEDEFYRMLSSHAKLNKALSIHAIGDKVMSMIISTILRLDKEGIKFPKIRLEHCQFTDLNTAKIAKKLGIILSLQPNFSIDSVTYSDRLSQTYLESNNPLRMFIDDAGFIPGKDLIFSSDTSVNSAQDALKSSLFPPYKQQKLTLEEFIAGYCMPDKSYGEILFFIDQKNSDIIIDEIIVN